jgi:hypothetical protein
MQKGNVPLLLVGLGELDLNAVDAVYTVDEEDQDEDKGYLHPILQFRYQWTFASAEIVRTCVEVVRSGHT